MGVQAALDGLSGVELRRVDVRAGVIDVALDPERVERAAVLERIQGKWPIVSVTES